MKINSKKDVEAALAQLKEQAAQVEKAIQDYRGRKTFLCACGCRHPIRTLTMIEDYAWSEGAAYEDGDWYLRSTYILCPHNPSIVNRLDWPSYYRIDWPDRNNYRNNAEQLFKRLYTKSFKEVCRTENRGLYATRNHYIDDNLNKFDITLGEQ